MLLIFMFVLLGISTESRTTSRRGIVVNEEINSKIFETHLKRSSELIIKNGFVYEGHKPVTSDGYILSLHRILHKSKKSNKPSVLFVNGFGVSAENWLIRNRNEALPYILTDDGFDVWMGDHRGTYESHEHLYLPTDSDAYWNTSIDEIGTIDLPTFVDYILERSVYKQMFYVGQSMGGTDFLLMASERTDYNDKINAAILFAPVGIGPFMPSNRNVITFAFSKFYLSGLQRYTNHFLTKDFIGFTSLCYLKVFKEICLFVMTSFFGTTRDNIDLERLGYYANTWGAGASVKSAVHFLQILGAGRLQKFDYGSEGNMVEYRTKEAPIYNITRITTLVKIYYGKGDRLMSTEAINNARENIPNLQLFESPDPNFSHLDALFGKNNYLLNNDVVILLNNRSLQIPFKNNL